MHSSSSSSPRLHSRVKRWRLGTDTSMPASALHQVKGLIRTGVISAKLRGGYLMPKIGGVCVGESLVGEGNEVAHVDLLLGPRGSAVETAYCIGLTNNKDGFTTLLALVAPNLMCKPPTILYNKVTIKDARQAVQMFGPAQHAVAK